MCGLSGYWLKNTCERSSDTILNMLQLQHHRGPDDSGIVGINRNNSSVETVNTNKEASFIEEKNIVFGFNRLSILDLSQAGHQPMIHEESNVVLMMNGEVYNAFDFKEELESKGFHFKGNSDTEVVLYLYVAYGIDGMLQRLNGMFAIAIYDGRSGELLLARDRVGIKPLYVLQENDRISFSSEIKSFKALSGYRFELEEKHISEFLLFRNLINKTLFKDILNIEPGTYWSINRDGEIRKEVYFSLYSNAIINQNFTKEELDRALKNSIERQMISDVKLGCQLSGGVDSSLVTAYAANYNTKGSFETVSIVFDQENFSEKKYIDEVVNKFNLYSHQFELKAEEYFGMFDSATWHFEQPLNHPNTIGIKLLSREARKHLTVLLSGEGADESLAGYIRFLPGSNGILNRSFLRGLLNSNLKALGSHFNLAFDTDLSYIMQTSYGGINSASVLFSKFSFSEAIKSRKEIWDSLKQKGEVQKRKYELLTYLPDLLMRQDKMSMAHSIENRVPFLDNEMLDASLSISDELLVKKRHTSWEGKWLLKEICADHFGDSFAYRNKMGFGIPLKSFFTSDDFQNRWHQEILPSIKNRGIFETKKIELWSQNPGTMNPEQLDAIWIMLGFEVWANKYLD